MVHQVLAYKYIARWSYVKIKYSEILPDSLHIDCRLLFSNFKGCIAQLTLGEPFGWIRLTILLNLTVRIILLIVTCLRKWGEAHGSGEHA